MSSRYVANHNEENKESWFHTDAFQTDPDLEAKHCRCLLRVAWSHLEQYGDLNDTSPYGICNASLSRGRVNNEQYSHLQPLGSTLAKSVRTGTCTTAADFDRIPTRFLYAHGKMREFTAKGRDYFSGLPSITEFEADPESFRQDLLERVRAYQRLEQVEWGTHEEVAASKLGDSGIATPTPSALTA